MSQRHVDTQRPADAAVAAAEGADRPGPARREGWNAAAPTVSQGARTAVMHASSPRSSGSATSWAEVDLGRVAHNVAVLRAHLASGSGLLAVVKADAYGHGAVEVARAALDAGAVMVATAVLDEALQLRRAGIEAPVLVMGWTPRERAAEAVAARLDVTACQPEDAWAFAAAAAAAGTRIRLHAKVDTGMGRLGWPCRSDDQIRSAAGAVAAVARAPGAHLVGAFTHFAQADEEDLAPVRAQLRRFRDFLEALASEGVRPELRHCGSTSTLLRLPEAHFELCRPGLGMYGYVPSAHVPDPGLLPVLSWYARIAQVRDLRAGDGVSYGATYVAQGPERVATLPVGYADGLPRQISNRGCVLAGGRPAPIRGRVCMDQVVVGVDACGPVRQGDVVTVLGPGRLAPEIAQEAGTNPYDILCGIGRRVPRVYV